MQKFIYCVLTLRISKGMFIIMRIATYTTVVMSIPPKRHKDLGNKDFIEVDLILVKVKNE